MTLPVFIVDTNVVVSGLSSARADSPTVRILGAMLGGDIAYLLSPSLLGEYREVLLRPGLSRFHKLHEREIDSFLTEIVAKGAWREPPPMGTAPDPGDNHLWDLLLTEEQAILITGDRLLLNNPPEQRSVTTPATCSEAFLG